MRWLLLTNVSSATLAALSALVAGLKGLGTTGPIHGPKRWQITTCKTHVIVCSLCNALAMARLVLSVTHSQTG
jgi:hypothetical protein